MGTQRLKIKDDLHYRKGSDAACCSHCNNFVGDFIRHGIGGVVLGTEARCMEIGMENSIKYRVNPSHICSRYDQSIYMLRLLGEKHYLEVHGQEKLDDAKVSLIAVQLLKINRSTDPA